MRDEQLKLERNAVSRGIDRYWNKRDEEAAAGRPDDNNVTTGIITQALPRVVAGIEAEQVLAKGRYTKLFKQGTRDGWAIPLCSLDPVPMAFIALKSLLMGAGAETRVQELALAIGNEVALEVHWEHAKALESEAATGNPRRTSRIGGMMKQCKVINPKRVNKWLREMSDLEVRRWASPTKRGVGDVLTGVILDALPDYFQKEIIRNNVNGKSTTYTVITMTEWLKERINKGHDDAAYKKPWALPMISPPTPWNEHGQGGYYALAKPLVRLGSQRHNDTVPDEQRDALNRVQATGWRINKEVMLHADYAYQNDVGEPFLPYTEAKVMPERFPDDVFAKMTRAQKGASAGVREGVHSHNKKQLGKRMTTQRVITLAFEFNEYETIYFPHSFDFRGRMYPISQDLNPQGDDMTKALLEFSEGKALGARGVQWLMYHAANNYGKDKQDRSSQEGWCLNHLDEVLAVAWATSEQLMAREHALFTEADKPWQFLAACIEIRDAMDMSNPEEYLSHLPVSVDGTCNGIQHLSAIGLDEVAAVHVNLVPSDERKDIYQIVADAAADAIEFYASVGHPMAQQWLGKVTRKVVKRAVMTTPYGITPRGMRDQLISDGWCEGIEGDRMKHAEYLRVVLGKCIAGTLVQATETMKWLKKCAGALTKVGLPITWTTPLGMVVRQEYRDPMLYRKRCITGTFWFVDDETEEVGALLGPKQASSLAPNLVHSFDAAHMSMTVNALGADTSFAMVHDSYGTHACDVDALSATTRATFVEIYSVDWFTRLQAGFQVAGAEIPDPPTQGTLDITRVMDSDFFFA